MEARSRVVFYVNDRRHEISGERCFTTLSEFLRHDLVMTGTKVVCAEGDCGACTVLLGSIHEAEDGKFKYKSVNSCILPLYSLDCSHVVTVEGLKETDGQGQSKLHPVQAAIMEKAGTQCGFCTPGFACAMTAMVEEALYQKKKSISEKMIVQLVRALRHGVFCPPDGGIRPCPLCSAV